MAGYLGITAAVQLVAGPLSDRLGRRPVLLAALVVFTLASLGCMAATDIEVFLCFRVLQAAIISGWALSLAVIRDMAPEREAASMIGYAAMAMAVAPMLGPMLGGALDELFGSTVLVGLGNGLTMPSANAGALSVRPGLAGSAAGLAGALTVGGGAILATVTGALLIRGNPAYQLFGMMFFCSAMGLAAALYVCWIERREGRPTASFPARDS